MLISFCLSSLLLLGLGAFQELRHPFIPSFQFQARLERRPLYPSQLQALPNSPLDGTSLSARFRFPDDQSWGVTRGAEIHADGPITTAIPPRPPCAKMRDRSTWVFALDAVMWSSVDGARNLFIINRRLHKALYKDLIDGNSAEKNLQRELWSENSCARQVFRRSNIEIPSLKDVNWLRFCREQLKPMDQAWEQS